MKFFLIVAKGTKQGMPIEIAVDLFLIGSERICQLRKDSLGGKHCALVTRDDKVYIQDLNSGHSTLVNGSVMPSGEEWPLHKGDHIAIGPLEFLIQFRESSLSGKDLEEWAMGCLDKQQDQDNHEAEPETSHKSAASAAASIINKLNVMKGLNKGRLRIGVEYGVTTVRFNDEMLVDEADISLVKKELCDHLNKPNMRVLLDLKHVKKLSTSAAMMLLDIQRWLRQYGSKMAFCSVRREAAAAMSMLQGAEVPTFDDKKQAIGAKW